MNKKYAMIALSSAAVTLLVLFMRGDWNREKEMSHETIQPYLSQETIIESEIRAIDDTQMGKAKSAAEEYLSGAVSLETQLFTSAVPGMSRQEVEAAEGQPDSAEKEEPFEIWSYGRNYLDYDGVLSISFSAEDDWAADFLWMLHYKYTREESDYFFERVITEYSMSFEEVETEVTDSFKKVTWQDESYYINAYISYEEHDVFCIIALSPKN